MHDIYFAKRKMRRREKCFRSCHLPLFLAACLWTAMYQILSGSMVYDKPLQESIVKLVASSRRTSVGEGSAVRDAPRVPAGSEDDLLVQYGDSIYIRNQWDGAPIVVEEYKLLFFTSAKVGCTVWKQLFRRMRGIKAWKAENTDKLLPWNPEVNGLRYLYHYNRETASHMMTSPEWTRAIIVRDPKTRLLSAYLDKVVGNPLFTSRACCPTRRNCVNSNTTLPEFVHLIETCDNPHWAAQTRRMEAKYWPFMNFVGHMETIARDAETLLRSIGAWEKYGATGWGKDGNTSIFQGDKGDQGRQHATDAMSKLQKYYTPELETAVDNFYASDYRNERLAIERSKIF